MRISKKVLTNCFDCGLNESFPYSEQGLNHVCSRCRSKRVRELVVID
jgi:hypothetical protein